MRLPDNKLTRTVTRRSVLIALTVLVAVLIIVDIALAADPEPGNTWSELVRSAAAATPVVPWLAGLVMGHWFHPGDELEPVIDPPGNALVLLVLSGVVLVIGTVVNVPPWLPFVVAAPIGAFVWPVDTPAMPPAAMRG